MSSLSFLFFILTVNNHSFTQGQRKGNVMTKLIQRHLKSVKSALQDANQSHNGMSAYNDRDALIKDKFHKSAKLLLRAIARNAGLESSEFDIRSNKGGIAVGGEVTLHTENLYLKISGSSLFRGTPVMFRSCEGRKDYTGGTNNFCGIDEITKVKIS